MDIKGVRNMFSFPIALNFYRCLDSTTAATPAKFQENMSILTPNFVGSRLGKILQ